MQFSEWAKNLTRPVQFHCPLGPIAFGKLVGVALLLPARCDPNGTRVRRQFPMARHPLIPIVAPCPIACDPHIVGRRLSQHDLRLERWRCFGHNDGSSAGRCSRNCHIGGFPTTTAGIVSGVVVVVVVVTERVGAGGGSAETMCDSGSETQPIRRPRAPQHAKTDVSCLTARTEAERDSRIIIFDFIFREYTRIHSSTMGYNPTVDGNIKFF